MFNFKRKKIYQHHISSNQEDDSSEYKDNSHDYIAIDKRLLYLGNKLKFHLFYTPESTHISLFLQRETIIDVETQTKLKNVEKIYISKDEEEEYNHFLENHLQNILNDDTFTLHEKTDIIYASTADLTRSLYSNPEVLENVQHSKKIVKPILDSIIQNENIISSYLTIIEYDYYTHTHSLNVSIYALSLGFELNLDKTTLVLLGQAALLHDLGKSRINRHIVNKETNLTSYELEEMKKHPFLGYQIAKKIGLTNEDILDGIHHHHEKLDGLGYPDQLKNDEITLFPRIIGVCDIFDALTTKRTYKNAMSSYDALHLMKHKMFSHLDMHITDTFIKMLHP